MVRGLVLGSFLGHDDPSSREKWHKYIFIHTSDSSAGTDDGSEHGR